MLDGQGQLGVQYRRSIPSRFPSNMPPTMRPAHRATLDSALGHCSERGEKTVSNRNQLLARPDNNSDGSPLSIHPEYTLSVLGLLTTAPTQPHSIWVRVRSHRSLG